jgi:rhamnulokinase
MHWDILRLLHEIKTGIWKASRQFGPIDCVGIDSWAVDFGLLDASGQLLGNPYHYRDPHTDGAMEQLCEELGKETIFAHSGIQFLPFNSIYQLAALKQAGSTALSQADALLMIPELLRYFLTGRKLAEKTNASTTQLFNPVSRSWDQSLIGQLGLPGKLFQPAAEAGTLAGELSPDVCAELGVPPIPVAAVAEHDTASAVVAVPAQGASFAYLSCGTWSLLGTELPEPVLSGQALEWNFTNEGGIGGTTRLLKNIMGLWIVQECRRVWERQGSSHTFAELAALAAQAAPFRSFIDPDDTAFLNPDDMPAQVRSFCERSGQPVPLTEGETIRCVLESLALKYRFVLERTEQLAGRRFDGLHMVGGGIHNRLLCELTASAIGRPVWAGPAEGSAIGNLVVQYMALGRVQDLQQARDIVRESFPVETYEAGPTEEWEQTYRTFCRLL